jgi:predicted small secreted protein
MGKKWVLFAVLFLMVALLGGCETSKGFAKGTASTVESTTVGASKDVKTSCNFIMALDNWFKKNLW